MTGEERRKKLKEELKAQYKKDLMLRKEFMEKASRLKQSQKMNQTISELVGSLEDDSDDWIEQLNRDSAVTEAKLDVMLEEASETSKELDRLAKEAEAQKFAAKSLVDQMKIEMGLKPKEKKPAPQGEKKADPPAAEEAGTEKKAPAPPPEKKPKKSLGDI